MRRICWLLPAIYYLMCSNAGTITDVNTGSISGKILNNGNVYKDSVLVTLSTDDIHLNALSKNAIEAPCTSATTADGSFIFDGLKQGMYSLQVTKDSMVLGQQRGIKIERGEHKKTNIGIIIVVNQVFNITNIINYQNVTINNWYFIGTSGMLDSIQPGQYAAKFLQSDTVSINAVIQANSSADTLIIVYIRQPDGSYKSEPLATNLPIAIKDGQTTVLTGTGADSAAVFIRGYISENAQ